MKILFLILLVMIQGCTINPTTNSRVSLICYKKISTIDERIKYKCSKKQIIYAEFKF